LNAGPIRHYRRLFRRTPADFGAGGMERPKPLRDSFSFLLAGPAARVIYPRLESASVTSVPPNHPRYASLMLREKLIEGVENGITGLNGLIAHGRGEAFDYLLGEETQEFARRACRVAAARLRLARQPVLSVNGNVAALAPDGMVALARRLGCSLEVNLFYRTEERVAKIAELLRGLGAETVYGETPDRRLSGLSSERGRADSRGIWAADAVLVPLEDGDRTEALEAMGKCVIAVDLNPLSRTARHASITIVDNLMRALPLLVEETARLKTLSRTESERIANDYDNRYTLDRALEFMAGRLKRLSAYGEELPQDEDTDDAG